MVRWKNTWLPKGELGNAQKLLREFEAKGRAQRGCKRGRPAGADKGRRSLALFSQKDHICSSLYQKIARRTPGMVGRSF